MRPRQAAPARISAPGSLFLGLACLLCLLSSGLTPANASIAVPDALPQPVHMGELTPGSSAYADGDYVVSSRAGLPGVLAYYFASPDAQAAADPCLTKSGYCKLYDVDVPQPAAGTLRVAVDSSMRGECFALELRDPAGRRATDPGFPYVCPDSPFGFFQAFNIDIKVPGAQPGRWQIRVMGPDVENWGYRVRAVLEGATAQEPDLLAPNLVPWLPSEFGFIAPASPQPGTALDRRNPPGAPNVSCHPDEEPESSMCLRFSAGVYNVGDGPLNLRFNDQDVAHQRVYMADGTPGKYDDNDREQNYLEVEAGTGTFHASHGHRHFDDMVSYQLFSAPSPEAAPPYHQGNALIPVSAGKKEGYCTFSQGFAEWFSAEQDDQFASFPWVDNCNTTMTLERGWGDIYRWQRPDQFLPYDTVADMDGTMKAGFYVVRIIIDPEDLLLETRENDNTGYAYIRVVDGPVPYTDRVVVCEQGLGKSPWDPSKRIVEERFAWAELLRDSSYRPAAC